MGSTAPSISHHIVGALLFAANAGLLYRVNQDVPENYMVCAGSLLLLFFVCIEVPSCSFIPPFSFSHRFTEPHFPRCKSKLSHFQDEPFHVPQTQRYCAGDFSTWDAKITTFPGLYLLSAALMRAYAWAAQFLPVELRAYVSFCGSCIPKCWRLSSVEKR